MSRISLAVLGFGDIAAEVHLPALAGLADARVVAVAEADGGARERAARALPDARLYDDYRQAVDDSGAEAVLVCLPPALHFDAAERCLRAGKHVYLEKPLATTSREGERLVETWRASGCVGALGFNYRFDPVYVAMARTMSEMGSAFVHARSTFTSSRPAEPAWKRRRATGGGALLDLASHHFDLVRHAFGREVIEVDARVRDRNSEADHAIVRLLLDDETSVEVQAGFAGIDEDRFELYFDGDRWSFDRYAGLVDRARSAAFDYSRRTHIAGRIGEILDALRKVASRPGEPSFAESLSRFFCAIAGAAFHGPDFDDGLKALRIVEAAEWSSSSGRSVSLD